MKFELIDLKQCRIRVKNNFLFTNLIDYDFKWEMAKNGVCMEQGNVSLVVEAGTTAEIALPIQLPMNVNHGEECTLTVRLVEKADRAWAAAGHEVAFEQFLLPVVAQAVQAPDVIQLHTEESDTSFTAFGSNFSIAFSKLTGDLISYLYQGVELMKEAPKPNFGVLVSIMIKEQAPERSAT